MDFRLAVMQDLQQLKGVYRKIIQNMNANNIQIWDDIYPLNFLKEDIQNNRLYVLYDNGELVSAFALCSTSLGEQSVKWKDARGKALYLDRLGVNVNYLRRGIGSLMLAKAKETAKALGAEYLRLFVVDINEPAIRLYTKNKFKRAGGVYHEVIDDNMILKEYGYEAVLSSEL